MIPSREAAQSLVAMRAAFLESLCQLALRARTPARAAVSSYAIVLETRKAARACLSSVVLQRSAAVWQLPSPQNASTSPPIIQPLSRSSTHDA